MQQSASKSNHIVYSIYSRYVGMNFKCVNLQVSESEFEQTPLRPDHSIRWFWITCVSSYISYTKDYILCVLTFSFTFWFGNLNIN